MIDAFIFDIGNVLLRFDFGLATARIQSQCSVSREVMLERIEPIKAAYEGGRLSRDRFIANVRAEIGFCGSEREFISAWEQIFTENEPMSRLVRELHGAHPLYLLSNTSDLHMDHVLETYPHFALFSDAVYSYRAGCSKPELAIYEIAIRQFGVVPQNTVFIDDLLANVESARALGLQAIHYDFLRHDALLEELFAMGCLPVRRAAMGK